jgi:hypothetical protein
VCNVRKAACKHVNGAVDNEYTVAPYEQSKQHKHDTDTSHLTLIKKPQISKEYTSIHLKSKQRVGGIIRKSKASKRHHYGTYPLPSGYRKDPKYPETPHQKEPLFNQDFEFRKMVI